jgi:hypothetical protein
MKVSSEMASRWFSLEIQTDSGPMIVIVAGGKLVAETKEALGFGSAKAHWQ